MKTSALIMMLITQGLVTAVTVYLYIKILNTRKDKDLKD